MREGGVWSKKRATVPDRFSLLAAYFLFLAVAVLLLSFALLSPAEPRLVVSTESISAADIVRRSHEAGTWGYASLAVLLVCGSHLIELLVMRGGLNPIVTLMLSGILLMLVAVGVRLRWSIALAAGIVWSSASLAAIGLNALSLSSVYTWDARLFLTVPAALANAIVVMLLWRPVVNRLRRPTTPSVPSI